MAGAQALKRIPRIKFPQRHPRTSGSSSHPVASNTDNALKAFLSRSASGHSTLSASGKASDQPMRTPVSNDEKQAILMGGCI